MTRASLPERDRDTVRARLRGAPVAKPVLTCTLIALFLAAYLDAARHPVAAVTVMPLGPIDRWIGFHPDWVVAYLSLWPFVVLGVSLMPDAWQVARFWAAGGVMAVVGLACYWAWPTALPTGAAAWSRSSLGAFLHGMDASGNACPSLHTAFALFVAGVVDDVWRRTRHGWMRPVTAVWGAAIVWSTLAVKQHVVLDDVAGGALGLGGLAVFWRASGPFARRGTAARRLQSRGILAGVAGRGGVRGAAGAGAPRAPAPPVATSSTE